MVITNHIDPTIRIDRQGGQPMSPPVAARNSVVPAQKVISLHTPVELGSGRSPSHRVELQREGDRIVAIHVFCRCGEQITLECDFEEESARQY